MKALQAEIDKLVDRNYELRFAIPTPDELAKLRQIYRELSAGERERLQSIAKSLRSMRKAFDEGDIDIDQLPSDVRTFLAELASRTSDNDDA